MQNWDSKSKYLGHFYRIVLLIILSLLFPTHSFGKNADPYAPITIHKLENGLTIVLAPSGAAKTVEIEMRVLTGWNVEESSNIGIAHLTEHSLFRDHTLRFGQTYLQRIQEAGGEASGFTTANSTSFFASVPSIRGIWVLNELSNILMSRKFFSEDIEKAKSEVLLKLGEPSNVLQTLFTNLIPTVSKSPDFFETEFSIKSHHKADIETVRRSTQKLSTEQVQSFYDRYYTPNNTVLFVAGPFKKRATLSFIKETYERYPIILPQEARKIEAYYPRRKPFSRSRVASRDSRIAIGTKFWNITEKDEIVLKIYFEHLAHRIMQKLRNEHGETYSAESKIWIDNRRFGYAIISFETPRQHFKKNLAYVRNLIYSETLGGNFNDSAIQKAREYYEHHVELIENDAHTMGKLASRLYAFQAKYGSEQTPFAVFSKMSNESFREHLRGLFHPRKEYLFLEEPPISFRGESSILYLLAAIFSLILCRRLFLKDFNYTSIRYVRKIKYQLIPATLLMIIFFNILWATSQISVLIDRLLLDFSFIQQSFVLSQYLEGTFSIFLLMSGAITFLCLIPRKIIVTKQNLIVKSLSYSSRKIEIKKIKDVFVCRPLHIFSHKLWNTKLRMMHWTPWKKGILIRTQTDEGYYLGFDKSEKVAKELQEVLETKKPNVVIYHDAA